MKRELAHTIIAGLAALAAPVAAYSQQAMSAEPDTIVIVPAPLPDSMEIVAADSAEVVMTAITDADEWPTIEMASENITMRIFDEPVNIYDLPYSMTYSCGNWKRLWLNTGVLCGAYVTTLLVLECLPEDATAWNRAAIQRTPPFNRWWHNVIELGPEWDHDNWYFNYLLHPYAGAAYFMSARSCGFNYYQSLLYSAVISTVGWEFGIEAFMERPSYQDIFITPLVGSAFGEGFYRLKRHIVENDYCLLGSPVIGNFVAFLIDPVNEVIGLFAGNPCRERAQTQVSSSWRFSPTGCQLAISCTF